MRARDMSRTLRLQNIHAGHTKLLRHVPANAVPTTSLLTKLTYLVFFITTWSLSIYFWDTLYIKKSIIISKYIFHFIYSFIYFCTINIIFIFYWNNFSNIWSVYNLLFIIFKKKHCLLISLWEFFSSVRNDAPREHMIPSRCIGSGKNKIAKKNKKRKQKPPPSSSSLVASERSAGLEVAGLYSSPRLRLPRAQPPRVYTPLFRSDSLTPLNLSERRDSAARAFSCVTETRGPPAASAAKRERKTKPVRVRLCPCMCMNDSM